MRIVIAGPVDVPGLTTELGESVPPFDMVPGGTNVSRLILAMLDVTPDDQLTVVTLGIGVREPLLLRGPRLTVHVGPYRTSGRARDAFRAERAYVRDTITSVAPDVVHAQWSYEFALGALATQIPTLVTVRDWAPAVLRYHLHPYRAVRLGMDALTLHRASHLTAPSPIMRDRVARWARGEVTLVPNGVEDARVRTTPRLAEADPNPPVVLAVNQGFGRLKNVSSLMLAWPSVLADHPDAELRLVGGGYEPGGDAVRWAQENAVPTDGVTFVGETGGAGVREEMDRATVFVHPSLEESFGMVVVEAMARGAPVIGGATSGAVPWLLADGAGLTTDVTDPAALGRAITRVLGDVGLHAALRGAGTNRVDEHFRLSVVARRFRGIYDEIRA